MLRLILLRHAKAVREHEAPSDHARTLTGRGRDDAAAASKALRALGLRADALLASTAARTRETAEAVAGELGLTPRLSQDLYLADPSRIWRHAAAAEADSVLIVGHNPGLHELVVELLDQSGERSAAERALRDGLPTAGFAAFDLTGDVLEAAGPRLVAAWRPEKP